MSVSSSSSTLNRCVTVPIDGYQFAKPSENRHQMRSRSSLYVYMAQICGNLLWNAKRSLIIAYIILLMLDFKRDF